MRLLLLPPVGLSWALVTTVLADDAAFWGTMLMVLGTLVPNTVLLFPSRAAEETEALKEDTAHLAVTVVAIAVEHAGHTATFVPEAIASAGI